MKLIKDVETALKVQDYSKKPVIKGVRILNLKRFNDDGGSLTEILRFKEGFSSDFPDFNIAQINYSEMDPGVIKAFHLHKNQQDIWYIPPSDKLLIVLIDLREDSETEGVKMRIVSGDCNSNLLLIPRGVAHGCKNISDKISRIIYVMDKHFNPEKEKCDEGRLPWDYAGKDIWEINKG